MLMVVAVNIYIYSTDHFIDELKADWIAAVEPCPYMVLQSMILLGGQGHLMHIDLSPLHQDANQIKANGGFLLCQIRQPHGRDPIASNQINPCPSLDTRYMQRDEMKWCTY